MSVTPRRRPAVSVSALVYLFADRIVKHSTAWSVAGGQYGVPVPCCTTNVQLGPFEGTTLAWVVWDLGEKGLVQVRVDGWHAISVKRLDTISTRPGFDGQVLGNCELDWLSLPRILEAWSDDVRPLPLNTLVYLAQREAISYGLLNTNNTSPRKQKRAGGIARLLSSPSADCERIGRLAPTFEALLEKWKSFCNDDPDLANLLIRSSSAAISSLRNFPSGN